MTQEDHFDVASYALGVLDSRDAEQFEYHLLDCPRCAFELDSFVQVSDLLAGVDKSAVIAAEETRRDGYVLQKVMGAVGQERRRANSRRLYSLAAAVVVFAILSIGAFIVGGLVDKKPTTTNNASDSSQLDPLPLSGDGPGVGGPDLPGIRYEGSDPRTGVQAAAGLEKKDMGTQITFAISNIKGPLTCRLSIMHTDGVSEPLSSWTVGEKGWGTAANPKPLMLTALTATPREQIAHIQVQDVATGKNLVSFP